MILPCSVNRCHLTGTLLENFDIAGTNHRWLLAALDSYILRALYRLSPIVVSFINRANNRILERLIFNVE